MRYKPLMVFAAATVAALATTATYAQADKKPDPYTQGADRQAATYEYLKNKGEKYDPYTQGANGTANALNPGAQPANVDHGKYDPYTQGARAGDATSPYTQGARAGDATSPYNQGGKQ